MHNRDLQPLGKHVYRVQLLILTFSMFLAFSTFPDAEGAAQLAEELQAHVAKGAEIQKRVGSPTDDLDADIHKTEQMVATERASLVNAKEDLAQLTHAGARVEAAMIEPDPSDRRIHSFTQTQQFFLNDTRTSSNLRERLRTLVLTDMKTIDAERAVQWQQSLRDLVKAYGERKIAPDVFEKEVGGVRAQISNRLEERRKEMDGRVETRQIEVNALGKKLRDLQDLRDHRSVTDVLRTKAASLAGSVCETSAGCIKALRGVESTMVKLPLGIEVAVGRLRQVAAVIYGSLFLLLIAHYVRILRWRQLDLREVRAFRSETLLYLPVVGHARFSGWTDVGKYAVAAAALYGWFAIADEWLQRTVMAAAGLAYIGVASLTDSRLSAPDATEPRAT